MTVEVPEGWKTKTLGELLSLEYGKSLTDKSRIPGEYPVYGSNGVVGTHNEFLVNGPGIIIGRKGTVGSVEVSLNNFWPIDTTYFVNQRTSDDFGWLVSLLKHVNLASLNESTGVPGLNRSYAYKYEVTVPSLPEQKKIAEVLSSVDEAIAATKAVIDQTKQVKKGLLQTLLTKGINHTKFKQTELGEIPESWEVGSLSEVIDDMKYGTSSKCDASDNGYGVLRIPNVVDERINLKDMKYAELSASEAARYSLVDGDILAVRTNGNPNYIGRMAVVSSLPKNTIFASYLIRIRVDRSKVMPEFIHYAALSPNTRAALLKSAKTSAGNYNINSTGLGSIKLSIPPLSEQREIAQVFQNIDASLETYEAHLQQLQTLKFGLMSDLLTGRKRVEV
jgi:type I restriction enzyme S subunit